MLPATSLTLPPLPLPPANTAPRHHAFGVEKYSALRPPASEWRHWNSEHRLVLTLEEGSSTQALCAQLTVKATNDAQPLESVMLEATSSASLNFRFLVKNMTIGFRYNSQTGAINKFQVKLPTSGDCDRLTTLLHRFCPPRPTPSLTMASASQVMSSSQPTATFSQHFQLPPPPASTPQFQQRFMPPTFSPASFCPPVPPVPAVNVTTLVDQPLAQPKPNSPPPPAADDAETTIKPRLPPSSITDAFQQLAEMPAHDLQPLLAMCLYDSAFLTLLDRLSNVPLVQFWLQAAEESGKKSGKAKKTGKN
ncbi:hypothetical protein RI367_001693 [Sorochytrium milnesiophthora]